MFAAINATQVWFAFIGIWSILATIYWMVMAIRAVRAHEQVATSHQRLAAAIERIAGQQPPAA